MQGGKKGDEQRILLEVSTKGYTGQDFKKQNKNKLKTKKKQKKKRSFTHLEMCEARGSFSTLEWTQQSAALLPSQQYKGG